MRGALRSGLALALAMLIFALPLVPAARAEAGGSPTTLENAGLKRTNQVLAILIALLKLVDEISSLPDATPPPPMPPPPIGTGHPGPGPLPSYAPDDPSVALTVAGG